MAYLAPMSHVALIAKITTQPGQRAAAIEAFQPLLAHAVDEPGTEMYLLHEDTTDDDLLWMYEVYVDEAAREAHRRSDVMRTAGRALGAFLVGAPEITVLKPLPTA